MAGLFELKHETSSVSRKGERGGKGRERGGGGVRASIRPC